VIEVKHLTKRYGNHTAVSNLSFHIEKGQIYGFLGPNGAGKSTTMNIMTGCLAATAGEVKVGGYDIFEEAEKAKKLIGYLPELPPLYLDRTPREYLRFVAEAKGVPAKKVPEQLDYVMSVTQIQNVADRMIKNLSKGYKQRVGIAQALLGDPEVIILDEPTVGLDPAQIIEIRELIKELGKEHTVILSSHILSEVQAVCQTVMIISKGKLVACDTPDNLEKLFAGADTVNLIAEATEEEARDILKDIPDVQVMDVTASENGNLSLQLRVPQSDDNGPCRELFFAFARRERAILQMSTVRASLEDIFIELTAGDKAAAKKEENK
jgi:ABC-2 type transport system ATP-binding protein